MNGGARNVFLGRFFCFSTEKRIREFLVEARNGSGSAASNNEPFVPLRVALSFAAKEGPPSILIIKK